MYGAILGDIIGSPYEFDRGNKTKDFPLFSEDSEFTDDTVMTVAVAEAFLDMDFAEDDDVTRDRLTYYLRDWARKYPNAGYGLRFLSWLREGGSDLTAASETAAPCGFLRWPGCLTIWIWFSGWHGSARR